MIQKLSVRLSGLIEHTTANNVCIENHVYYPLIRLEVRVYHSNTNTTISHNVGKINIFKDIFNRHALHCEKYNDITIMKMYIYFSNLKRMYCK